MVTMNKLLDIQTETGHTYSASVLSCSVAINSNFGPPLNRGGLFYSKTLLYSLDK